LNKPDMNVSSEAPCAAPVSHPMSKLPSRRKTEAGKNDARRKFPAVELGAARERRGAKNRTGKMPMMMADNSINDMIATNVAAMGLADAPDKLRADDKVHDTDRPASRRHGGRVVNRQRPGGGRRTPRAD